MRLQMTVHHLESGERRPDMNLTALVVTGNPAEAIVAMALVVMGFVGIPEARPFLLLSGPCGSLLGLILYRKQC
jgi:hypothetical protein